ncbi:exonuclease SbcCD subunit D [Amnibacterium endophyticum]|uniref:Nuclease SbcCD subunit D n=1 Tax=Amnibacterium endophyticum TaxID=2109337 RepID=A0ABW4LJJ1_9MICO
MRLLHTSDWHIGRTFHRYPTLDALRGVLAALADEVRNRRIDAVLVAGDVFDSATPSAEAFRVFEEAVLALRAAGAVVVMTSGNHDSAARLGHQAPFAAAGGVHVRTRAEGLDAPVVLEDEHGAVDVYGLPYLEPLMTGHRSQEAAIGAAMERVRVAAAARGNRSVVLSHCFASSGVRPQAAGGERDITSGGLDVVPTEAFEGVDYVALGHIHSRSVLAPHVRYSGAPLHYSFGETSPFRGAWQVDLDADGFATASWVDLPVPRALTTLRGDLQALLDDPAHEAVRDDWLQVVLTDPGRQQDAMARLRERFPWVAVLEHRPEGAPAADGRSYGERTAGKDDLALVGGFLEMVRDGSGPDSPEAALIAEVLAASAAAERAA